MRLNKRGEETKYIHKGKRGRKRYKRSKYKIIKLLYYNKGWKLKITSQFFLLYSQLYF